MQDAYLDAAGKASVCAAENHEDRLASCPALASRQRVLRKEIKFFEDTHAGTDEVPEKKLTFSRARMPDQKNEPTTKMKRRELSKQEEQRPRSGAPTDRGPGERFRTAPQVPGR